MGGVANTRFEADTRTPVTGGTFTSRFETTGTDFALALGGGLDVRVSDRISIRAIQVDYNPVFLGDLTVDRLNRAGTLATQTLEDQRADNIRISVGIVF